MDAIEDPRWQAAALAYAADAVGSSQPAERARLLDRVDASLDSAKSFEFAGREQRTGKVFVDLAGLDASIAAHVAASRAFARAGQANHAADIAAAVPHPGTRRRALIDVVAIIAGAGHADKAQAMIMAPRSPYRRAAALAKVAEAAFRAGYETDASRALSAAFEMGSWETSGHVLGQVSPPALARLADDIHEDFKQSRQRHLSG